MIRIEELRLANGRYLVSLIDGGKVIASAIFDNGLDSGGAIYLSKCAFKLCKVESETVYAEGNDEEAMN